ncbi:hypothetical protein BJY04DRAFT_182214 [Aspergillus karnatakaensis]|uniref:uncharacterized protein n=1 Tax=Aspergillus karnatakaensis TaxID=1810916 RepID=UPI003CCD6B54
MSRTQLPSFSQLIEPDKCHYIHRAFATDSFRGPRCRLNSARLKSQLILVAWKSFEESDSVSSLHLLNSELFPPDWRGCFPLGTLYEDVSSTFHPVEAMTTTQPIQPPSCTVIPNHQSPPFRDRRDRVHYPDGFSPACPSFCTQSMLDLETRDRNRPSRVESSQSEVRSCCSLSISKAAINFKFDPELEVPARGLWKDNQWPGFH